MNRVAVESSFLAAIGYDSDSSILKVEFQDGDLYQYQNVPTNIYEEFMDAPSKGTYLNTRLKDPKYPHKKIR